MTATLVKRTDTAGSLTAGYRLYVGAAVAVPQCPQWLMVAMFGPEGSKEDCGKNSITFFLSAHSFVRIHRNFDSKTTPKYFLPP